MAVNSSFNSDQWLKNMNDLLEQFNNLKKGNEKLRYFCVKKIFDFCIADTRWINDSRLIRIKNMSYLKLDEFLRTHNHQYVKYFNKVKIQLQCAEQGIDYTKTNTYIGENYDEFERLYEDEEFERLYEDEEFERIYGENDEEFKDEEFERIYGENDEEFKDEETEDNEFKDDEFKDEETEDNEFERLYGDNVEYPKKNDLSTLSQYSISIANISPIVCRL
jgi:hypothetical protein